MENERPTDSGGPDPEELFRALRDRPAPEIDAAGLWRRIEARLTPRGAVHAAHGEAPMWARLRWLVTRPSLLAAAATLVVAAVGLWLSASPSRSPAPAHLVVLPPIDAGAVAPGGPPDGPLFPATAAGDPGAAPVRLEVRLVRGYDGPPPPQVQAAQAMGVGGADALRDVRAGLEALLPFESFGIVGAGSVAAAPGQALDIELSEDFRLVGQAEGISSDDRSLPGAVLRLRGVRLVGAGQGPDIAELNLEPGRLLLLGVVAGADAPHLVLVLRAVPAQER